MMTARASLAALLACTIAPQFAWSGSFSYEIQVGSSNGFQYSYIHAASGAGAAVDDLDVNDNFQVRMSGVKLFELSGDLEGDLTDTGTGWQFDVSPSTLNAKVLATQAWMTGASVGDIWSLNILGGTLSDVNKIANFGGRGSLNYVLTNGGSVTQTGTWHFFADLNAANGDANRLRGAPNSLSASRLDLWGNNWRSQTVPTCVHGGSPSRLGIDLGGIGNDDTEITVPLPGNAVNVLALLSTVFAIRRYRRVR